MAKKSNISSLFKKGMTGLEAGTLIVMDFWEKDHGREGFLSDADVERLRRSMVLDKDRADFNAMFETFRLLDFTNKEANILYLEMKWRLHLLTRWAVEAALEDIPRLGLPKIMTEEEYQEDKARLKEWKLQRYYPWHEVEQLEGESRAEGGVVPWEELVEELFKLVEKGKLTPVKPKRAYINRLQALEDELALRREEWHEWEKSPEATTSEGIPLLDTSGPYLRWYELLHEKEALETEALQQPDKVDGEALVKKARALLKKGKLDYPDKPPEEVELLQFIYLQGRQVAKVLPHWKEFIEDYTPGYPSRSYSGVAIIRETSSWANIEKKLLGEDVVEYIPSVVSFLEGQLRLYLATRVMLKTAAQKLGAAVDEDVDRWMEELRLDIKVYNRDAMEADFPLINIDKLRPTKDTIRYFNERIEQTLGPNWWHENYPALFELEPEIKAWKERLEDRRAGLEE